MTNKEKIWTTRKGNKIPINDMTTSHIINAIEFFNDKNSKKKQVEWLIEERDKRLGVIDEGPVNSRFEILDL